MMPDKKVGSINYRIEYKNNVIKLLTTHKLPFQAKGSLQEMKRALQRALLKINAADDQILYGQYISKNDDPYMPDLENAMIYNLNKLSVFNTSCKNGLVLERIAHSALWESANNISFNYCQKYQMIHSDYNSWYWCSQNIIAEWNDIKIDKFYQSPGAYWKIIKNNKVNTYYVHSHTKEYGIEIKIFSNKSYHIAGKIKALIDGIIVAFHSYSGEQLGEVSQRVSRQLDIPQEDVERMLMDSQYAVLGKRKLIWPFKNGVQWNPADDEIVFINILKQHTDTPQLSISGRLFTVEHDHRYSH